MTVVFPLSVLYTQITVFRTGLPRPGLLWEDDHVAQGFAWSLETVAFGIPDHDGECLIRVETDVAVQPVHADAIWSIAVPFLAKGANLDIGTVGISHRYGIEPDNYQLTFDALPGARVEGADYAFLIHLRFAPSRSPVFEIRRKGDALSTNAILRENAERA